MRLPFRTLSLFFPSSGHYSRQVVHDAFLFLKEAGIALINNDRPMEPQDQARELKATRQAVLLPATKISLDVAGMDAANMALMGCIGAITGLTNMAGLERAVKDRFPRQRIRGRSGTAALDVSSETEVQRKAKNDRRRTSLICRAWLELRGRPRLGCMEVAMGRAGGSGMKIGIWKDVHVSRNRYQY